MLQVISDAAGVYQLHI